MALLRQAVLRVQLRQLQRSRQELTREVRAYLRHLRHRLCLDSRQGGSVPPRPSVLNERLSQLSDAFNGVRNILEPLVALLALNKVTRGLRILTDALSLIGAGMAVFLALNRLSSSGPNHAPLEQGSEDYAKPDWLDAAQVNIAVVGNTSVGKSSLVNFLRGVRPEDATSAPIGVNETTTTPAAYRWQLPEVVEPPLLWDCPGSSTLQWTEDYVQKMGIRYFDAVLVVTDKHLKESEYNLIRECIQFNVPVHCIFTKVDCHLNGGIGNALPQLHGYFRSQEAPKLPGFDVSRFYTLTCHAESFTRYQDLLGPELTRLCLHLGEDIVQGRLGPGDDDTDA